MTRSSRFPAMLLASSMLIMGPSTGSGNGQEPTAPAPQPIGAADLLRSEPFDRITLIDGTILIVEPVSPRPLPVIDPKLERERRKRGGGNNAATLIEVGGKDKKPKSDERPKDEDDALESVRIHLVQGGRNEVRDFVVKRSSLKKIEYFEDLLLEEADRLVLTRDFARAFECCLRVKARNPAWAGLDDRVNRVLFTEGRRALIDGDDERGLRLLRELLGRKRDYPGLLDQIAQVYGKRIERAIRMGFYARGRRVLHELEEVAGEIAAVGALRALFTTRASEYVRQAEAANGPERLDALTAALRIWPTLPGADELYTKAFRAEPTLDVGVTDVASPLGPWQRSRADGRLSRLLYRPVLADDDQDSRQGKNPNQLAASLETSDLGRRLLIKLRPGPTWSDGSRPVSAIDLAHTLIERSDPHSPTYEARWADLLDRVEVLDETRVEVRLNHAPLKVGGWFTGPVAAAHAGLDGRIAISPKVRDLVTDGVYRCASSADDQIDLRLRDDPSTGPEPAGGQPVPRIRRVREIRLSQGQTAVTALRRGDVTMIDHVPPDQLASLAGDAEIHVGSYTQPVVHVIAIDGRNPALRSRPLRRGLSYAIDRRTLLEETILKRPPSDQDAPADGPFPKGSYADATGVKPLEFNIMLAKMLVVAAKKEIGVGAIRLKFEYPAIPGCRAVAAQLAEAFQIAGVEIETIEWPESRLENELRAGRRFDLAYRVIRCDDPILNAGPIVCPGYDAPPQADTLASAASPRILQLLLQLERAAEWPTARGLAIQIDREARDELPVIPLWQLVDHYAWRSRLKGPDKTANQLYQRLEYWEIDPWIARDPWEKPAKTAAK